MKRIYSVYEAKARLSEILRLVRERKITVTVSHHGEPIAEIRPVEPAPDVTARLAALERRGAILPKRGGEGGLRVLAKKPGALARFLAERD